MRLIDADALIEFANNLVSKSVDANDIARFHAVTVSNTINAVPAVHGRWENYDTFSSSLLFRRGDIMTQEKCSICNRWHIGVLGHIKANYCPNCGARMDGAK